MVQTSGACLKKDHAIPHVALAGVLYDISIGDYVE